ncbi:hypothetical protein HZC08_01795 [Candidatus Micrarchaeota archaeon]|nr:hypothetical protein [Candidatus Micrarchaeota archaeon]
MKVKPMAHKTEGRTKIFRDYGGNTFWNDSRLKVVEDIVAAQPTISIHDLTKKLNTRFPEREFGVGAVKQAVRKMKNAKRFREKGF